MPEQWNKYAPTAARRHGKPGRETRPKSVTIDIHSHVVVPAAAKFVEPHLDWRLFRWRITPRANQGAQPETGSRHPRARVKTIGLPISTPWVSTSS